MIKNVSVLTFAYFNDAKVLKFDRSLGFGLFFGGGERFSTSPEVMDQIS